MRRRRFLAVAGGAIAGSGAAAVAAPAAAQERREIRLAAAWPAEFPGFGTATTRLAKRITLLTAGALTVTVVPPADGASPFGVFDAVAAGEAHMYHAIEHYWIGRSPAFAFFAGVPFGLAPLELLAWVTGGGGQALWDELAAGFKLKPLIAGHTGAPMAGWFAKDIRSADDLRGLKIAASGLGGAVLRRIGASAVAVPGRQLAGQLGDGGIDGALWFGPWTATALGLHKAARFLYYPGVLEPGTALSLGVNLELWQSLPVGQQLAIETAAAAETLQTLAEFETGDAMALAALRRDGRPEVKKLPDEVLMALGTASGQVVAEIAAFDAPARRIYDAFLAFRRDAVAWSKPSLSAYLDARLLPFRYEAVR